MSYRAQCLRDHLEDLMEGYIVTVDHPGHEIPSVFDGPVVVISDRVAGGITLSLYGDDGDPLSKMAANLWHLANNAAIDTTREGDPMMSELSLSFSKMIPLLDPADFHIGERLEFVAIEHSFDGVAA